MAGFAPGGSIISPWPTCSKTKTSPGCLRAAKNTPQAVFAIAGGGSLQAQAKALGLADLPNVCYLGYVSDGEAKALMSHCQAFLFPTLYEGFGIRRSRPSPAARRA